MSNRLRHYQVIVSALNGFHFAILFLDEGSHLFERFNVHLNRGVLSHKKNELQVAIFLIMGCIKMYNSFMFVTGEYRTRIVNKTNNLEMFHNYIQSLPKEEVKTEVEDEQ